MGSLLRLPSPSLEFLTELNQPSEQARTQGRTSPYMQQEQFQFALRVNYAD
jgi:hypothetical protein